MADRRQRWKWNALIRTVKSMAAAEVMPRFTKVAHHRRAMGAPSPRPTLPRRKRSRGRLSGTIVGE
ncbi:MAG: hypothetical protein U1E63_01660 [Burkholderiales bacterium]